MCLASDIDECANNPCQNGGICTNQEATFVCRCQLGWTDKLCDKSKVTSYGFFFVCAWFMFV